MSKNGTTNENESNTEAWKYEMTTIIFYRFNSCLSCGHPATDEVQSPFRRPPFRCYHFYIPTPPGDSRGTAVRGPVPCAIR